MKPVTFGCDPEFALVKDNAIVPCIGLLPGTKDNPYRLPKPAVCGTTIQEDGVAVEIGMRPVGRSLQAVAAMAFGEATQFVEKALGNNYSLFVTPAYSFEKAQLTDPRANVFGCDPDFQAYKEGMIRAPFSPKKLGSLRCFGGHVHIGYDKEATGIPEYALVLGIELGLTATLGLGWFDLGPRSRLYGTPGIYRPKSYGVEYRTPTAAWVTGGRVGPTIEQAAKAIVARPDAFHDLYDQFDWDSLRRGLISGSGVTNEMVNDWRRFVQSPIELTEDSPLDRAAPEIERLQPMPPEQPLFAGGVIHG